MNDPRTPAIMIVGSMCMDLVTYAGRLPERGETVIGDRFATGFGGKGANQATMAARLGARVAMAGGVGDDPYGAMTIENLAAQGIDTTPIRRIPGPTGVAPIWVEPDGSNRIIVVPGANGALRPADGAGPVAAADALDVVVGQFEIGQEVTAAAFAAARTRGAVTILNPAPAAAVTPELLAVTDWLIPNETELAAAAGASCDPASDADLAAAAAALGVRLLVTLGAQGAALVRTDGTVDRIAAPRVHAMDTTGAGDAFVGAFAWALGGGHDEDTAVLIAIALSADSVTRAGTQTSFADPARAAALVAEVRSA